MFFLNIIFNIYFKIFNLKIHIFNLYHTQLFTNLITLKSYLYNKIF